jgi:WD40 repeat protein
VASGKVALELEGSEKHGWNQAVLSPDGKKALAVSGETLALWDATSGEEIRTLWGRAVGDGREFTCVAFTTDEKSVVAVDTTGRVTCWEVSTGRLLRAFTSGHKQVGFSAISTDAKSVLIGSDWSRFYPDSDHDTLRLLDTATGKLRCAFGSRRPDHCGVAVSADGTRALSGGPEAVFWDLGTGKPIRTIKNPSGEWFPYVALSPDGGLAVLWGFRRPVKVWDVKAAKFLYSFGEAEEELPLAFTPDGKQILTLGDESGLTLREAASGKPVRRFVSSEEQEKPNPSAVFSPDGKWVLTGGCESDLLLWDVASGKQVRTFVGKGVRAGSNAIAFSASGKWAVTGGCAQTLRLWDVATGRQVRRFVEPLLSSPSSWD